MALSVLSRNTVRITMLIFIETCKKYVLEVSRTELHVTCRHLRILSARSCDVQLAILLSRSSRHSPSYYTPLKASRLEVIQA